MTVVTVLVGLGLLFVVSPAAAVFLLRRAARWNDRVWDKVELRPGPVELDLTGWRRR